MSEDLIRYDLLTSEALRGIIRAVLQRVQKRGLPGEHHFYITFDTNAAGTIISKRLHEQYPEEMTIVLQHTFWDLIVYDDRFEVKLSFNQVPERLVVPYSAIKRFIDPSVSFVVSPKLFAPTAKGSEVAESADAPGPTALPGPVLTEGRGGNAEAEKAAEPDPDFEQEEQPVQQTAEVVKLDLFRKK